MIHEIALGICLAVAVYAGSIDVAPPRPHNFQPHVALLKPNGFSVTISDTWDIQGVQLLGDINEHYNRSHPYEQPKVRGYVGQESMDHDTLTLSMPDVELHDGDVLYYLLLIEGYAECDRYVIHNLSFTVKEVDGQLTLYNYTVHYNVSTTSIL